MFFNILGSLNTPQSREAILKAGDVINFSGRESKTNGYLLCIGNNSIFFTDNSVDIEETLNYFNEYTTQLQQQLSNLATIVAGLPAGAGASAVVTALATLETTKKQRIEQIIKELK